MTRFYPKKHSTQSLSSDDINDYEALTSNHFFIVRASSNTSPGQFEVAKLTACKERAFALRNQWMTYQASLCAQLETFSESENELGDAESDGYRSLDDNREEISSKYQNDEKIGSHDRGDENEESSLMEGEVSNEGEDSKNAESTADENKEDCQESKDDKITRERQKRVCPFPRCNSKVVHLPRHLRTVHKCSKEYARTAISRFGLRRKYAFADKEKASAGNRKLKKAHTEKRSQKKPCRKMKRCPLTGCMTSTNRLPQHLQKAHKLQRTSPKYNKALSIAKVILRDEPHIFLRMKQESERYQGPDFESALSVDGDGKEIKMVEDDTSVGSDDHEADTSEASCDSASQSSDNIDIQGDDVSKTMRAFGDWLLSPDGGKKDRKTAKQHVSQLHKVLSVVGEGVMLSSLLDTKRIGDTFLQRYAAEKYHAATIKSYLLSLQHYCSFLLADQPSGVVFDKEHVLSLREKLKRWSASYNGENNRRRWEKMEEDRNALITPEKIGTFERSQAARDAITLLGQLRGAHAIQITQDKYTLVRDYLIAQIMIDNANRAGVVTCMTVMEFERATLEGDRYVVRVLHHKTVDTHGPAQVVLTSHLYNYIKVFMKEMRSQLPGVTLLEKQTMFLSWCGKPMESSQMTKAFGSIFKKAGVNGPVHHTLYRKSVVSHCHEQHKEISGNLADLMAHREETAQKYYRVFEKSKSSVKASRNVSRIMRNDTSLEALDGTEDESEEGTGDAKATEVETPLSGRKIWNEERKSTVRTLFAEEIAARNITISCVRQKIQSNPVLCGLVPKRVYDRVRAEWRFNSTPDDLGKETANPLEKEETIDNRVKRMFQVKEDDQQSSASSDILSSSETTAKSRGLFAAEHVQILLHLFQDMINGSPISKQTISATLQNDNAGKSLLSKFTLAQIVNRLKYERSRKERSRKPQCKD
ncbi:hypothetical protein AWC38_SpisGene17384 [Stylophora pistillata]|uniref:Tyr recombinase domain-containing protein n=1 Tax=Stylophora pistillata TaxID=50429 RepID=A0A2B4RKX7_STYPI|nr:hypothetical protein AWC38_SpisGene17384 [Stylophora pistillata]